MITIRPNRFAIVAIAIVVDALPTTAFGGELESPRCGAHFRDFSQFQNCFGDPDDGPSNLNCRQFDFDSDGAVDLGDYASRTFILRTRIAIFPISARLLYSQPFDFRAAVFESGTQAVTWSLRPVPGGEPGESLGSIDANGRYTPPSILDVRAASELIVDVSRAGSVQAVASSCVSLYGTIAARPSVSADLPAAGGAGFVANVTVADPRLNVVLPGIGGESASAANVTVANPLTAIVLPGEGDADLTPPNVTVAYPPVNLVLTASDVPEFFTPNITVADPPVAIEFEDAP